MNRNLRKQHINVPIPKSSPFDLFYPLCENGESNKYDYQSIVVLI